VEYRLGRSQFENVIAGAVRTTKGRLAEDVEEVGERIFRQSVADLIYPEMRELVRAHQHRGHTVVLSSSALTMQAEPVARYLGIDHVVCNRFVVDENGVLTGEVQRPVIWGTSKATSVQRFAAEHGVDLRSSYFYADGDEDLALIDEADFLRASDGEEEDDEEDAADSEEAADESEEDDAEDDDTEDGEPGPAGMNIGSAAVAGASMTPQGRGLATADNLLTGGKGQAMIADKINSVAGKVAGKAQAAAGKVAGGAKNAAGGALKAAGKGLKAAGKGAKALGKAANAVGLKGAGKALKGAGKALKGAGKAAKGAGKDLTGAR